MADAKGKLRRFESESKRSIRMTADRILVASPKEMTEHRSRGGIVIPATVTPEPQRALWAEVVAVGPMVRSAGLGDLVLFSPENTLEVSGEEYIVVRERDIHAVASDKNEGATGLYL